MEVPTETVKSLSDTAWGAILVLTTTGMSAAIVCMWFYIRSLTKQLTELSEKRVEDVNELHDKSQKVQSEAVEMVNKATRAIEDLQRKVCDSNRESRESMDKTKREMASFQQEVAKALNCRECPARSHFNRRGGNG